MNTSFIIELIKTFGKAVLVTAPMSLIGELANEFRMFKDIADAGYKIKMTEMSKINKQINPNNNKTLFINIFLPIWNLYWVTKNIMNYNMTRTTILDQLSIMDVLEEMTEEELKEYKKKPTALNAIFMMIKSEMNKDESRKIEIKLILKEENNEESEITFLIDNTTKEITILNVSGKAKELTKEEQLDKINEHLKNIIGSQDDVETALNQSNQNNISLAINKATKSLDEETLKTLQKIFDDLINETYKILKFKEEGTINEENITYFIIDVDTTINTLRDLIINNPDYQQYIPEEAKIKLNTAIEKLENILTPLREIAYSNVLKDAPERPITKKRTSKKY